ncbi:prolipoprotein diacylglyceryl transferase, partial [Carbonactinospora thermoautotrophica]|uniref:prolipoprotein diacylglyceryl transferase n=1 Tax=Carbonactinospora thermoautotrophica TaxID=1469144 RepID=UPI00099E3373
MNLAYIPSPPTGVVHIGPVPLRAYAFCIILGVIAAIAIGERRWVARGGEKGLVGDIAIWAVPFGLVGGRLYHVITSYELYFGPGGEPVRALYVWQGGLGIWGAIVLGGVGAWIGCRRRGVRLPVFADAVAPGIAVAQAIGRWGNWFNQELFGRPTTLPWGLEIDPARRPATSPDVATYHPTFLYEFFWNLGVAGLVVWADRKWRLGHGRAFALYVAAYCAGRGWIEYLRVDEAHHVLGLRLNVWTSILVFLGAVVYFALSAKLRPGREETVLLPSAAPAAAAGDAAEAPTAVLSQGAAEATTLPKAPPVEEEKQEEKPGVAVAEAPTGKLPKAPPVEQPVAVKDEKAAAEEAAKARAEQEAEQVEAAERAGGKTQAGEEKPG